MPLNSLLKKILTYILKPKLPNSVQGEGESFPSTSNTAVNSPVEDGSKKKCDYCKGRGVIIEKVRDFPDEGGYSSRHVGDLATLRQTAKCPVCKGNGYVNL